MPATASRSQRWRAYDYGARDVGERDNASAGLLRALYEAQVAGGGIVELDSGVTIQTRSTLTIPAGVELVIPAGTTLRGAAGLVGDVVAIAPAAANAGRVTGGGTVDGNRAAGLTGNGISASNAADAVIRVAVVNAHLDGVSLVNCTRQVLDVTASSNGRHGVYHSGSTFGRGQITARDNGQRVAGSGVVYDAGSADNAYSPLVSTDTRAGGAKTQQYGVLEPVGSGSDRNVLAASALTGNAVGPTSLVGANSGTPFAPASVTNAVIADGAVYGAKIADRGVAAIKLAIDALARSNVLTNGGFEHWPRSASPGAMATAQYFAERWQVFLGAGGSTLSMNRDATNVAPGSLYSAAFNHVKTGAASFVYHVVTGGSAQELSFRGRTVSFSAAVLTSTPNAVRLGLMEPGGAGGETFGPYHSGSGQWETLTVTRVYSASAPANCQARVWFDLTATGNLDNAALVYGPAPVDFAPLHPLEDLARVERYYEVFALQYADVVGVGQAVNTTSVYVPFRFRQRKPATPTITCQDVTGGQLYSTNSGGWVPTVNLGAIWATLDGCMVQVYVTPASFTAGQAIVFAGGGTPMRVVAEAAP